MITDPYIGMPITLGGSCPGSWVPPNRPPIPPTGNGNNSGNGSTGTGSGTQQPPSNPSTPDNPGTQQPDTRAFDARYLGSLPVAMAYVPMQQWKTTYTLSGGLSRGTIFPELDLPFEGRTILSERAKGGR